MAKRPKDELVPSDSVRDELLQIHARWESSLSKARSPSQLSLHLNVLEHNIAFEYSVVKAKCQGCRMVGQPEKLLFCDLCNMSFHTYCLKPQVKAIPEGDWYCKECRRFLGIKPLKRAKREKEDAAEQDSLTPINTEDEAEENLEVLRDILVNLEKHRLAWPFLKPVSRKIAPDYYDVIKEPVDVRTMTKKLDKAHYDCQQDVLEDFRLMFQNCYTYNQPGSDIYVQAEDLESYLEDELLEPEGLCDLYKSLP